MPNVCYNFLYLDPLWDDRWAFSVCPTEDDVNFQDLWDRLIGRHNALKNHIDQVLVTFHAPLDVPLEPLKTLSSRGQEWLRQHRDDDDRMVTYISDLNDLFPTGPSRGILHFIVASRATQDIARSTFSREDIAQRANEQVAPSRAAKASTQRDIQDLKNPDAVYNWRPCALQPPPIAPYFPAFATFARDLDILELDVTPDNLASAFKLVVAALDRHENQRDRRKALQKSALYSSETSFAEGMPSMVSRDFHPDLQLATRCPVMGGLPVTYEFTEIKDEIGEGGSDALVQAERDYATTFSSPEARPLRDVSCCPAILIGICGPYIIFSGAVFAHVLIAQRLSSYIFLGPQGNESMEDAVKRVARMLRALKKLREALRTYYQGLKPQDEAQPAAKRRKGNDALPLIDQPSPSFIGPTFNTFVVDDVKYALEYTERLDPDPKGRNKAKAVFRALARPVGAGPDAQANVVVVKFVKQYGKEGHELLAKQGMAPTLHSCERIDELGGLWMVVMDFVEERKPCEPLDKGTFETVKKAVKALHDQQLVFGDLRRDNILVTDGGPMLIDFDWCGKETEARYPVDLNMSIDWPVGVNSGTEMKCEHDNQMLAELDPDDG